MRPATPAADPQEQIGALRRELIETRKQQTATSKILEVISRSPDDLSLFDRCDCSERWSAVQVTNVSLLRVEAELMRHVASHGDAVTLEPAGREQLTRGSLAGRAIIDGKTIHIDNSRAPANCYGIPRCPAGDRANRDSDIVGSSSAKGDDCTRRHRRSAHRGTAVLARADRAGAELPRRRP